MQEVRTRGLTLAAIGAIGASLLFATGASAASIVVDSPADPAGTASECTLRQALQAANTDSSDPGDSCGAGNLADTITFSPGILPTAIELAAGELVAASDLTIQGPGTDQLAVDAIGGSRVFRVPAGDVTIAGLVITGGAVHFPGPAPEGGGGVLNQFGGTLTLDHVAVIDNTATSVFNGGTIPIAQVFGGGILNVGGSLTVTDSLVSGNTLDADSINGDAITAATADGAGISSQNGALAIDRSTISGNTSEATASSATGARVTQARGAIVNFSNSSTAASITSSTIVDNTMTAGAADSRLESGGGIYVNAPTSVTSSTVTGNDASGFANLDADVDGSIALENSIVAEPVTGVNCGGVTSSGHNFSDDATCDPNATGDLQGADPHLLPLADYGGPNPTRPPEPPTGGNPSLIDQGVAAAQATDQRGRDRTWDFDSPDGTDGDGTDIGAAEIQGPVPLGTTPTSPGDGATASIFGSAEQNSTVSLFESGSCSGSVVGTAPTTGFATPGINPGGTFGINSSTTFSTQAAYGDITSVCSTPITYQRRPALPTLTATNPPSGSDSNTPFVTGTATASSTVNIYRQAGCAGSIAASGTGTDFSGVGIAVAVPDNSTTSLSAQATGVGGTSDCSAPLTYSEVTPGAPTTTTPEPPATKKKCRKGFKLKKGKCKKRKK